MNTASIHPSVTSVTCYYIVQQVEAGYLHAEVPSEECQWENVDFFHFGSNN